MNGISFTLFSLGWAQNDMAMNLNGPNWATVHDKEPTARWWDVAYLAVLIHHPTAGYILYDTGHYIGNTEDRLPPGLKEIGIYHVEREDLIDKQLERVGLSVNDIDSIILSHGHFDHVGGVGFFSGTKAGKNVYISQVEMETALLNALQQPGGYQDSYFRGDFEFPEIQYHFIQEGEFAPGIELISLEGHTQGSLGLMVHCDGGTYIFPSDAVYTTKNYGPPAILPGFAADTLGFYRSIEKLYTLEKKYNAKVIFPHDAEQLRSLKTAPYFYK